MIPYGMYYYYYYYLLLLLVLLCRSQVRYWFVRLATGYRSRPVKGIPSKRLGRTKPTYCVNASPYLDCTNPTLPDQGDPIRLGDPKGGVLLVIIVGEFYIKMVSASVIARGKAMSRQKS